MDGPCGLQVKHFEGVQEGIVGSDRLFIEAHRQFFLLRGVGEHVEERLPFEPEFALRHQRLAQHPQVLFLGEDHVQSTHAAQACSPCREESGFRLARDRAAKVFCTRYADEEHRQPKENTQAH